MTIRSTIDIIDDIYIYILHYTYLRDFKTSCFQPDICDPN